MDYAHSDPLARPARILLADDNPSLIKVVRSLLVAQGFSAHATVDGIEALDHIFRGRVDLAILGIALEGIDGLEVLRQMRLHPQGARIPAMILGAADPLGSVEVCCLEMGADDFLAKPVLAEVLLARIKSTLRRAELLDANPLTALPGNRAIQRFLDSVVDDREEFWAIAYLDLDGFKAFNDHYSFLEGDALLALAGSLLKDLEGHEGVRLIAHLGGDDFVLGFRLPTAPRDPEGLRHVEQTLDELFSEFERRSAAHYAPKDRDRGYIEAINRKGQLCRYPLATVSAALVSNAFRTYQSALDISRAAGEVKVRAKRTQGSCYFWDQRAAADTEVAVVVEARLSVA